MVGRKNRFEKKGKGSQQGLIGPNLPVVDNMRPGSLLFQCPDAASIEVAPGFKAKAVRVVRLGNAKEPAQGIRQPAFGHHIDYPADAFVITGRNFRNVQIDGGPPFDQTEWFAQYIGDLFNRAIDVPVGYKMIIIACQCDRRFLLKRSSFKR